MVKIDNSTVFFCCFFLSLEYKKNQLKVYRNPFNGGKNKGHIAFETWFLDCNDNTTNRTGKLIIKKYYIFIAIKKNVSKAKCPLFFFH